MYFSFDENERPESPQDWGRQPEQTDRVNGEYHYKNGYTQKIYSDAHYIRDEENTVPPRYYTPPERPVKEVREKPAERKGAAVKIICLCLCCALLGGFAGGTYTAGKLGDRLEEAEYAIKELAEKEEQLVIGSGTVSVSDGVSANKLAASTVYDIACSQTVGITSEITYRNFFGMTSSAAVSGSGFIVSSDGYIITNNHVIEDAYNGGYDVSVMLHDGTKYQATIVGTAKDCDLAVLKIEAEGLSAATLGNSDELKVGDTVYAVGNPLGELEFSMSTGSVSAKDRDIATNEGSVALKMFQIDAAVNSGNSGGPLYDDKGQVVGVVSAKYQSTGVEGLGFAIPINDAASIANDLITKGYVTGIACLGVLPDESYNSMYSRYYNMPMGAYIDKVYSGTCAEKAGLRANDIIVRVGDYKVEGVADLQKAIKSYSAGDTVEIEFYRANEIKTTTVTFDEKRPEK